MKTKKSVFAGSFYPSTKIEIQEMLAGFFHEADAKKLVSVEGKVKALICPHAGYIYSGFTAAFGYNAIKSKNYSKVIVLGLSHQTWFQGVAVCDDEIWETPLGNIPISAELAKDQAFDLNNEAFAKEHSVEVQLPFLQTVLSNFTLYPLVTGEVTNHSEIAGSIKKYIDDDTLLVVSSDLSHYHPYKRAQSIDEQTSDEIISLKGIINHEQACGADGVNILMHLAREFGWKPILLDQRNSGDTAGSKDEVVGYASICFVKF